MRSPSPPPKRFQKSIEFSSLRDTVSPLATLSPEHPASADPPSPTPATASPPLRKLRRLSPAPGPERGSSRCLLMVSPRDGGALQRGLLAGACGRRLMGTRFRSGGGRAVL